MLWLSNKRVNHSPSRGCSINITWKYSIGWNDIKSRLVYQNCTSSRFHKDLPLRNINEIRWRNSYKTLSYQKQDAFSLHPIGIILLIYKILWYKKLLLSSNRKPKDNSEKVFTVPCRHAKKWRLSTAVVKCCSLHLLSHSFKSRQDIINCSWTKSPDSVIIGRWNYCITDGRFHGIVSCK